jgi:hypothetical protein
MQMNALDKLCYIFLSSLIKHKSKISWWKNYCIIHLERVEKWPLGTQSPPVRKFQKRKIKIDW